MIYTELDPIDSLYIVYQGECKLKKRNVLDDMHQVRNRDDIINNKNKLITVVKLGMILYILY